VVNRTSVYSDPRLVVQARQRQRKSQVPLRKQQHLASLPVLQASRCAKRRKEDPDSRWAIREDCGAGDGGRTRDLHLGKVPLYH
jgi:hypothetical protein